MHEVKKKYFELVKLLNTSNKLKNEKTELKFYFDESGKYLMASVDGYSKIYLCVCNSDGQTWASAGYTGFKLLESKIADILYEYNRSNIIKFNQFILTRLFQ